MHTIEIKKNDLLPPPTGNPIELYSLSVTELADDVYRVSTGLWLGLPSSIGMEFEAIKSGLWITGHQMVDELVVIVLCDQFQTISEDSENPFAKVYLTERETVRVRFIERSPEGGRIVRGEAVKIEDSSKTRDA